MPMDDPSYTDLELKARIGALTRLLYPSESGEEEGVTPLEKRYKEQYPSVYTEDKPIEYDIRDPKVISKERNIRYYPETIAFYQPHDKTIVLTPKINKYALKNIEKRRGQENTLTDIAMRRLLNRGVKDQTEEQIEEEKQAFIKEQTEKNTPNWLQEKLLTPEALGNKQRALEQIKERIAYRPLDTPVNEQLGDAMRGVLNEEMLHKIENLNPETKAASEKVIKEQNPTRHFVSSDFRSEQEQKETQYLVNKALEKLNKTIKTGEQ